MITPADSLPRAPALSLAMTDDSPTTWLRRLLLLQVALLAALTAYSVFTFQLQDPAGDPLAEEARERWRAADRAAADDQVWLEAAIVELSRSSTDEVVLVAGACPVSPGQDFDLTLSFSDLRGRDGARPYYHTHERDWQGGVARHYFEARSLGDAYEYVGLLAKLEGTYVGAHDGLHALLLEDEGRLDGRYGAGSHSFRPENLVLEGGDVACFIDHDGERVLLFSLRDAHDPPFDIADLAAWSKRTAGRAEARGELEQSRVEEALVAIYGDGDASSRVHQLHPLDPLEELVELAVAFADVELRDRAQEGVASIGAGAVERLRRDESVFPPLRATKGPQWLESGRERRHLEMAFVLAELVPFDPRETRWATELLRRGWRSDRYALTHAFDPVRSLALVEGGALAQTLASDLRDERNALYELHRFRAAIVHRDLGSSEAARAEWRALRPALLGRIGPQGYVGYFGLWSTFGAIAIPWLLALGWVAFSARGSSRQEPSFTQGELGFLLLLTSVGTGKLAPGFLAAPAWFFLSYRWLGSGARPRWHAVAAFFACGSSLSLLLIELSLLPTSPQVQPWIGSSLVFGAVLVGAQLATRPERWATQLLPWMVAILSFVTFLVGRVPFGLVAIPLLGLAQVLFNFFITSEGDPQPGDEAIDARRASASSASTPSASATLADPKS